MTQNLNITDILFMFDNVLLGDTPAPGADPLAPDGIRTIDGTNNNISGQTLIDQFGNLVDTATFGNTNHGFVDHSSSTSPLAYGIDPAVVDTTPRLISNLIADATGSNPATAGVPLLAEGDAAVDRLPENSLFTFFGQFFDHGLDFISKQNSGVIMIPILPGDPLFDPAPGAFNMMPVTRAELDGNGDPINTTAPFIEQSQTYGSLSSTTFYLMEYDINGIATGDLVHGADGGMGTWADIKENANRWARAQPGADPATEMLTDADVLDVPDPTMWDPAANGGLGGFLPGAGTGQPFLADIAHNANPSGGLAPDANAVIDPHGFGAPPPAPGEYDDELLDAHFVSGDARVNENTALIAIHQAFHGEHRRLVAQIKDWVNQQDEIEPGFAAQWDGEMFFQAAKLANEMQYQHIAFEDFARRMSPNIDEFAQYEVDINPNITTEFSQAVYRLGHSQLTDTVKTTSVTGEATDLTLVDAFLDPETFSEFGAGAFLKGGQFEQGSRIDEFVVDALRNFLVGLPLDLAAINIARGRDVDLPTLNQLRADLFAQTGETSLRPYDSWADFGANLLNPDSLVNYIAAYSNEATIAAARLAGDNAGARAAAQTMMGNATFMDTIANGGDDGFERIDLWIGGLGEKKVPLGLLGSTFDFVFAQQMLALQNGDRFYYLARLDGNILDEIEGQTLADLMMRGGDAIHLGGDVFGTPDVLTEMSGLALTDLLKTPGELTQYLAEIIGGTNAANMIQAGAGNDAVHAEGGDDTVFGGENDDHIYGGDGNDSIWGEVGFDLIRGDDGDDTIRGGADDDALFGGRGNDMIFGDNGFEEMAGGEGNDTMFGGAQDDEMLGGDGHDVMRGGGGADGVDGGAGNDVLFGGGGSDRLFGGEGDDLLIGGSGGDQLDGGVGGYDIASYETWLETAMTGSGLIINMLDTALSSADARDDSYLDIEAVRGTKFNDTITGDDLGKVLIGGFGDDLITGGLLDDTLIGSEGNDSLNGGGGIDTVLVRGLEADFTLSLAIGGFNLTDNETVLSTDEGTDFVSNNITWLSFDDALFNLQTSQYAPLIGLSDTVERTQNGTTVIGELQSNVVVADGTSLAGAGVYIGDIEIADPDGANGGPQVLALAGPDAAAFTIQNVGGINQLFLTGGGPLSNVNYEVKPYYNVTLSVADAIGGSEVNVTVNVSDVNDNAPVFTSGSRVNVAQNTSTDAVVYWAKTDDLDTTGEAITYTLGGADAGAFTLIDGELRFVSSPSFAAPADVGGDNIYNVTIDATDGVNMATQHNLAVHVQATAALNTIVGTPGNDTLNGSIANELLLGLAGADLLLANGGNDRLEGGDGADALLGGNGDDRLFGEASTDTLNGGAGADTLDGGENSDEHFVDGDDVVTDTGGVGFDKATIVNAAGDNLNLAGWSGVERINGNAGNDTINGAASTEDLVIAGQAGNDSLTGGSGNDILLGGGGNDTLEGGGGNDTILGGADDDMLSGGTGDDVFFVGETLDAVTDGGTGFDKAVINNAAGLTISIGTWLGVERINGWTGADTIDATGMATGIVMSAGDSADVLTGGSGNDTFYAGTGNDTVEGGGGDDALIGNAGMDRLHGGGGNDFLLGGGDADVFVFETGWGQDRIKDYTDGTDQLEFSGIVGVTMFSDLTIEQDTVIPANTLIHLGGGDVVTVDNMLATDFDAGDFIFT
ncbi:peroxidase family protein [Leisingera sp. D0M16]|uniref:peroxidase family protein n=1 Tax=Leisingera coralii TaxID=3351347 RepID=UPI003B7D0349